jgi:hypothetical protein
MSTIMAISVVVGKNLIDRHEITEIIEPSVNMSTITSMSIDVDENSVDKAEKTDITDADTVSIDRPPRKQFTIREEMVKLDNGLFACKHCPKQFKVVPQVYFFYIFYFVPPLRARVICQLYP